MIKLEYQFTFLNQYINAERRNKYIAAKIKRDTTQALTYMLLGKEKIPYPCGLHFHWILKNKRMDLDNVGFAKKFVLDALVKAGLLPDDGLKYITELRDTYEIGDTVGVEIRVIPNDSQ